MKRWTTVLALAALWSGAANAANLDFGVSYRGGGGALWNGGLVRVGVSDLDLGPVSLTASVSNRAAEVGLDGGLSLAPLGAASAGVGVAVPWTGGVRLASRATATLGPVALNVGGSLFTAAATRVDPLAGWTLEPTDLRTRGWNADLTARYRVSRTLIAVLGGELGAQPGVMAGAEWRRDLTRVLPPEEGDDPEAGPATERTGTLGLRLGARAGQDVLGLTGGVSYAAESGLTLALDALVGTQGAGRLTWGAVGSVSAQGLLGEGSAGRLYAAYEPWRTASALLRVGAEVGVPAGPGTLSVDVRGGTGVTGEFGFGARVGYRLPLGGREARAAGPR